MKELPARITDRTASLAPPRQAWVKRDRDLAQAWSRFPFIFLTGFVATQGHQIPVVSLPINWAVWPNLSDLFAVGLVLTVVLSPHRVRLAPFDRGMLKDLLWIGVVFLLNFLLLTIPSSATGEGVKYGAYSLMLMAKYILVYWAAAHVPIDERRMRVLHLAALLALLWVSLTMLADRLYLIEIDVFAEHLPWATAGKWSVMGLNSTVSASHGGTTVVILILGALAVGTAQHRLAWLVEGLVFVLGTASCFISGGRQGLVRMLTFVAVYSSRRPTRYLVLVVILVLLTIVVFSWVDLSSFQENLYYTQALERQEVLLADPFSNEGLAGRPDLWRNVLSMLNVDPVRWVIGYGIGNYAEYRAAAHNMVLRLLQDGGVIELVLFSILWMRILRRIWAARREAWAGVALTAGMLTSVFTSAILYPTLATGWYLGLYFVSLHVIAANQLENTTSSSMPEGRRDFEAA